MRVLVLGGNRYIGLQLLFELARQGHEVTVMNSHLAPMPEGCRRLHGDRQSPGVLDAVLGAHRDDFDAVFDNTSYAPKDVQPLIELFRGRVRHYVFTSSAAVYRRSYIQPVAETSRTHDPADEDRRKAYGVGKVRCEQLLRTEFEATGFPATTMRVSHTIGPRSPLATREPVFFERLQLGRPIPIPGEGFPFVHLVHTLDAARCMAAVLGNDRAPGQTYNVAGDEITSVLGAIRLMAKAVGVEPNVVSVPLDLARKASPPLVHWGEAIMGGTILATDRVKADLGWAPAFGLEAGYRDAWEEYRDGGRERYTFDFSADDRILEQL